MISAGRRRRPHRRGASLIESILCIPLIAVVLGLTFFFGWAMRNQQRVIISDRYAVWRRVLANESVGGGKLDQAFFGNAAGTVGVEYGGGPDGTLHDYVAVAGQSGAAAEQLTQRLVLDRFPRSHSATVSADFPTGVGLWSQFTGAIERRHVREGLEWRRGEAALETEVRDQFLTSLDGALRSIPAPADGLGQAFRQLYLQKW